MRKVLVGLVVVLAVTATACSSNDLDSAATCADLSDVDVSSLSADDAEKMGDLVFEFAQSALTTGNTEDYVRCQELVQPLDQVGVTLDLVEMDRN